MTVNGSAGKFRILLLGTPVVMQGEQPLHIQRRLTRALLYYLAFHEHAVPRSQLVLLFWPDASEQDGRRRLREILSKLRAGLPDPNLLVTGQEEVSLDPHLVTVDAREFVALEEEVRKGTLLSRSGRMLAYSQQQTSQAALLWRASRFMAGFELPECMAYQDWQMETSRSLEFLRLNMLSRLADHHLAAAEPMEAIRWLRTALEIDELDGNLHLRLLKGYRDLGRIREALAHCEHLQDLYQREGMGAIPKPIQQICAELRHADATPTSTRKSLWPLPIEVTSPFVGREPFVARLRGKYANGGAVVIMGESGSGKSRLIFESCQGLQPEPRLLVTCGRSLESDMPLQPWIDVLRREVRLEEWEQIDPAWHSFLKLLFPELDTEGGATSHPPLQGEANLQRSKLFEAIRQLLLTLGKKNRLVVIFDDAQWGDQASYALLSYLLERGFFQTDHMLLIASRVEESCRFLDELIQKHDRNVPMDVVALEELQPDSISLLVQAILGATPDAIFIQRLSRDTGGNPLLVLEILRAILDANIDPSSAGGLSTFPIPASIRSLVTDRLNAVSADTRKVVLTAAVMGMEFSSSTLAPATGIRPDRLADILEKLERDHLIRTFYGTDPQLDYTFVHEKVREVFLASLSPVRLRLIHKKVAEALEQMPGLASSLPFILARHYEQAGMAQQAFIRWLESGQHACKLLSTAEATQAFVRAEKQLQRIEPLLADQKIYSLYTTWGEMALEVSDFKTKQDCFQKLLEYGRKRNSPLLIGTALSGLANLSIHKVEPAAGLESVRQAIPLLKRAGNVYELIMAYNRQAMAQQLLLDMPAAVKSYQQAQKFGADSSDLHILDAKTISLTNETLLHVFLGFPETALRLALQAMAQSRVTGNLANQCRAHMSAGISLDLMSDIPASLEIALNGIELCQQIQADHTNGYLQLIAAKNEFRLGLIDKAWQRCEWVSELAKDRFLEVLAEDYHLRGYIYLRLAMIPEAIASFQKGMSFQKDTFQFAENAYSMAYCMGVAGKTQEALAMLDQIIENAGKKRFDIINFPSLINKTRLLMQLSRIDEAEKILQQVKSDCEPRKYWEHFIVCALDLGRLELKRGNRKAALQYTDSVIRNATRHKHMWHELDALKLESECLASSDPRTIQNRHRRLEILEMIRNNCQLAQFQPALDALQKTLSA